MVEQPSIAVGRPPTVADTPFNGTDAVGNLSKLGRTPMRLTTRAALPAALTLALAAPATASAATTFQQTILDSTPAPQLYWPLDETCGTTGADLAAGAHAGTLSGVTLGAAPAFGGAQHSAQFAGAGSISGD